jgi:hypothetical protein
MSRYIPCIDSLNVALHSMHWFLKCRVTFHALIPQMLRYIPCIDSSNVALHSMHWFLKYRVIIPCIDSTNVALYSMYWFLKCRVTFHALTLLMSLYIPWNDSSNVAFCVPSILCTKTNPQRVTFVSNISSTGPSECPHAVVCNTDVNMCLFLLTITDPYQIEEVLKSHTIYE